jgi:hypothetical protein
LEETAVLKEQKERKENHFQFSLSIHQKKGKFLCDVMTAVLLQQENTSNAIEKIYILENSSDTFLQELNHNSSKLKTEIHQHFQEVRLS